MGLVGGFALVRHRQRHHPHFHVHLLLASRSWPERLVEKVPHECPDLPVPHWRRLFRRLLLERLLACRTHPWRLRCLRATLRRNGGKLSQCILHCLVCNVLRQELLQERERGTQHEGQKELKCRCKVSPKAKRAIVARSFKDMAMPN